MRKIITMVPVMIMAATFVVGCSSSEKIDGLYLSNCLDGETEMGRTYLINNLEDGSYEIEFTAKEYEYGVLKEEHELSKATIGYGSDDKTLKIGVDPIIVLSGLVCDKEIAMDSEVAIAVYSTEGKKWD